MSAAAELLPAVREGRIISWLNHCPFGGKATNVSWVMPDGMIREEAILVGQAMSRFGRSFGWWLGDWYLQCDARFGGMKELCADASVDWGTARNAAVCCRSFTTSRRRDVLSFTHHLVLSKLSAETQDELLDSVIAKKLKTRELAALVKQERRSGREGELAGSIEQASAYVGHQLYGVLYADPPWRFEPFSRESGMDRAADNHYPTMTQDELFDIEAMRAAPAEHCVLFCWATVPMLEYALEWCFHYGFAYRSHIVWLKDRVGTGYWVRNRHELLLITAKGEIPAPAPGTQPPSVIEAPVGRHSEKPAVFAETIEGLFPSLPKLELFARGPRAGWDTWGAEAETPVSGR